MMQRYILPGLAAIGLIAALFFTHSYGREQERPHRELAMPPAAPFDATVSGTGLVEANTRNIEVGSHLSGIVEQVLVKEGAEVAAGEPLFALDALAAQAEVERLAKDVNAAEARVATAKVALADEQDQLGRIAKLKPGAVVSIGTVQRHKFAAQRAGSALNQAQAELESAQAALQQSQVMLERLSVRAPVAGRILKVHVEPGEFIAAGGTPAVLMGGDRPLHLRVAIDENDVWRFSAESEARASLRSNKDISFPLEFVRTEPYVEPKRNLSGDGIERVDTRVLEVIYSFDPGDQPIYIGQQMDAFIEAKE